MGSYSCYCTNRYPPIDGLGTRHGQREARVAVNLVVVGFGTHDAKTGDGEQAAQNSVKSGRFWPPIHCVIVVCSI